MDTQQGERTEWRDGASTLRWQQVLHDEVLHHLLAARDSIERDACRARAQLQLAISELQRLCEASPWDDDTPSELGTLLRAAARDVVAEGVDGAPLVTIDVRPHPPLSAAQTTAVVGAVREALRNVARHTPSGTPVRVRCAPGERSDVRVSVVDRGGGPLGALDAGPRGALDAGRGIRVSIIERIRAVGGEASVEPLDDGVRVVLSVPTRASSRRRAPGKARDEQSHGGARTLPP